MAEGTREPELELDCRGLSCPLPVIRLANNLPDLDVGGVVRVYSDDPAARPDIPAWCRMRGHDYLGEGTAADGTAYFDVRRLH